jgi:hypothetical protein
VLRRVRPAATGGLRPTVSDSRAPVAVQCERTPLEDLSEPGHHDVDVGAVCVITRFGLHSPRYLLPTYRDYRRVLRAARESERSGLLQAAFLVESPTTCYSLSIWEHEDCIATFGSRVQAHVDAGRRIFGRLRFDPELGPELWSAKWRLATVSHNLNWREFPFRAFLAAKLAEEGR